MIKSTFDLEHKLAGEGYRFIIGIDEAGRGPLAGPVVAGAVIVKTFDVPNGHQMSREMELIRDSKKLSGKQREAVYDFICENFHVGIGICDHKTIDRINILEATYLAAKKAVSNLCLKIDQDTRDNDQTNYNLQITNSKQISKNKIQNSKSIILFDGNKNIPNLSIEQKAIINGDSVVKSISAASIIAKVTRDRIMLEMHEKYPNYKFDEHKGYGTGLHMKLLQEHGPCEIHRRSFAPVRKLAQH
ncbi:MAG TPA: ribonuclease HII [Candidatus Moranbacteria bacterium]|nr:ribonuclease HII [Candidatus Moranbacteria bacterium]